MVGRCGASSDAFCRVALCIQLAIMPTIAIHSREHKERERERRGVGLFSHDCDTDFNSVCHVPRDANSCEIRHLHLTLEKWNGAEQQGAS